MLDIQLPLLLASAVIFLIVMVLLNSILYKPLLNFMSNRDSSIKKDLENANQNSADVDKMHQEAKTIIANARAEAAKIIEKAKEEANLNADNKISLKKKELEKSYSEFVVALATEQKELKNALMSQVPLYRESLKAKFAKL
ncbi:MAG: F0F1 ATP synthase subunit B' [Campylobacterales bacterium]|nr:F0F1 ATP synthase subunit B' [Campylobacterales bacterium]